jgi:transcriptional regulator NrdR family protein
MQCPKCHTTWISVLESRHTTPDAISRRRKCKACDHVWATAEVVVPNEVITWKNVRRSAETWRSEFAVKASVLEALKTFAQTSQQAILASSSPIRPTA